MSSSNTVRFPRMLVLFMNEIKSKSPPLQNAAEY